MKFINVIRTLLLLLLLPLQAFAQQVSHETLKQVLLASGGMESYSNEQMTASLTQMAKLKLGTTDDAALQQKTQSYLQNHFLDDLTDVMAPYYTELTEADCQELIKAYNSEQGKSIVKRITNVAAQAQEAMAQQMQSAMLQIMSGQPVTAVEMRGTDQQLKDTFMEYYKLSGANAAIDNALGSMESMSAQMQGEQKTQFDNLTQGLRQYLSQNTPALTYNLMLDANITQQDLQFYVDILQSPAGQHLTTGSLNLSKDVINMGQQLVDKVFAGISAE